MYIKEKQQCNFCSVDRVVNNLLYLNNSRMSFFMCIFLSHRVLNQTNLIFANYQQQIDEMTVVYHNNELIGFVISLHTDDWNKIILFPINWALANRTSIVNGRSCSNNPLTVRNWISVTKTLFGTISANIYSIKYFRQIFGPLGPFHRLNSFFITVTWKLCGQRACYLHSFTNLRGNCF